MQKKTKITKHYYSCDGGCLKLINEQGASVNLNNHCGDGKFDLYLIESVGWGPVHFNDKEDYGIYKNFEREHPSEIILYLQLEEQPSDWKVLFYDCDDKNGNGIILSKTDYNFISVQRDNEGNFYVYAYYKNKEE